MTLSLLLVSADVADGKCRLREFAAVVRGEKPPTYTLDHDLIVQEALMTASGMA